MSTYIQINNDIQIDSEVSDDEEDEFFRPQRPIKDILRFGELGDDQPKSKSQIKGLHVKYINPKAVYK